MFVMGGFFTSYVGRWVPVFVVRGWMPGESMISEKVHTFWYILGCFDASLNDWGVIEKIILHLGKCCLSEILVHVRKEVLSLMCG